MFIRRFAQLQLGLLLYGASLAHGPRQPSLNPWNVFHRGPSELTGISLGSVVNILVGLVLLIWIPLCQKLGIGTISNVLVIGAGADAALWMLPTVAGLPPRFALPLGAVLLNGGLQPRTSARDLAQVRGIA